MGFNQEAASSSSHVLKVPSFPTEDTPLLRSQPLLSSKAKTFANVFIAIVGAGVLGLAYTFKKTGWVTSSLMVFVIAFLSYRCMMLLIHTRRRLESLQGFKKIASFGDLGFTACGPSGRLAVDVMIILAQAGFCASYLIFISNTPAYIFNHDAFWGFLSRKPFYIWGCFPFQLGLNSIPTLTHLAPLSIFADVIDVGAMSVVMVKDILVFLQNKPVIHAFKGFSSFFYGLGVAIYAFEGIGMVLPLESEAEDKEKFSNMDKYEI